jgi:MFS family permease
MYDRRHRAPVFIACAGAFLAFLDTTIVNIAFPDISASFAGSGRDALSWVLDGYFVVIAALLVPAGGSPTASATSGSSCSSRRASPRRACSARSPPRWGC